MLTHFLIGTQLRPTTEPSPVLLPLKPAPTAEQHLLAAVLAGDQQAHATLVRRYRKMVLNIALGITGSREDAEEATQDTFVRAFRYLPAFRGDSSFKTWLFRIARTTSLNQLRVKGRPTVALDAPESPAYFLQEKGESSAQQLIRSERAELLGRALQQLSREDETVLKLFYLHEKSLEEICAATGWTFANAKSRVHRARQRLRKVLVEQFGGEEWN